MTATSDTNSSRDRNLKKNDNDERLSKLSEIQREVTQNNGTEMPFDNPYWDNHEDGIYVDIVSGEPLFSSRDKFDSGTGWPSFSRALVAGNVIEKTDKSRGMTRVEIRSKHADSHLGHLFDDGPPPTGMRYCINSASLKFISKNELKKSPDPRLASHASAFEAAENQNKMRR